MLAIGASGLMTLSARADIQVFSLASDAEFLDQFRDLRNSGDTSGSSTWHKYFGGNVRWGTGASDGDWEYAVVDGLDIPFSLPGQGSPSGDRSVSFSHVHSGASPNVTLTLEGLGSHCGTHTPGLLTVNTVFVRAKAGNGDVARLDDLVLTLGSQSYFLGSVVGDDDAAWLGIVSSDFNDSSWSFSGRGVLGDGSGSLPMYQWKVGSATYAEGAFAFQTITPVPEVNGAWFASCALLLLGWMSREHRRLRDR